MHLFYNFRWPAIVAVMLIGFGVAMSSGNSGGDPAEIKIAEFPILRGKVQMVAGSLGSYIPPQVGDTIELSLGDISEKKPIRFKAGPKSKAAGRGIDSKVGPYIPVRGQLRVKSVQRHGNGVFQSMRLAFTATNSHKVKIDVVPKPGIGKGPNGVYVWMIVEGEVTQGVALIVGEASGVFPAPGD